MSKEGSGPNHGFLLVSFQTHLDRALSTPFLFVVFGVCVCGPFVSHFAPIATTTMASICVKPLTVFFFLRKRPHHLFFEGFLEVQVAPESAVSLGKAKEK